MNLKHYVLPVMIGLMVSGAAAAGEKEELLKLKSTTMNLIEALVKEGILSEERADEIISQAEQSAEQEVKRMEHEQAQGEPGVVRVPYVPDFVRDEIKQEVRAELRQDVVGDVMSRAEKERWGMPDALPDWTRRFKFSGDMRLRAQADQFSSDNPAFGSAFVDYSDVNDNGGFSGSFLNTDEDRYRARLRLRLGIKADITRGLSAGIRLATGSTGAAVSTNETLDNNFGSYDLILDRAYLKYKAMDLYGNPWLTAWGGRMPNPWFSSDLVWDSDLNFDGGAVTYHHKLGGSNNLLSIDERERFLFATVGAFSLDEVELSSSDKWLIAGQVGADLNFEDQSRLRVGLAYYDYQNIEGRRSPLSQPNLYDFTAPGALQKGNSMFDISNDPGNPYQRFGLASDFDLLNLTAEYDMTRFAPVHVILLGDYVRNLGYDSDEIRNRIGGNEMFVNSTLFTDNPDNDQVEGYQAKVTVGWPNLLERRSWQVSFGYKYLERDAVLDAYTDSDFHLGGTNAEGWILGASYGILQNTYLKARYLSADEIDGPPLGIDLFQLDLVSKF